MKIIAFVLVFFIQQSAIAQIYMWTDKNGVKHFTNTAPPPEATDFKEEGEAVYKPEKQTHPISGKEADKSLNRKQELEAKFQKKSLKKVNQRQKEIEQKRIEVEAARGNLKKNWEKAYGPLKGKFVSGYRLQTNIALGINVSTMIGNNLITLTDGSAWRITGAFPRLQTAGWMPGDDISLNKNDGIIVNKRRNADCWVKVVPAKIIKKK